MPAINKNITQSFALPNARTLLLSKRISHARCTRARHTPTSLSRNVCKYNNNYILKQKPLSFSLQYIFLKQLTDSFLQMTINFSDTHAHTRHLRTAECVSANWPQNVLKPLNCKKCKYKTLVGI